MIVKFRTGWYAPSEQLVGKDRRTFSGRHYPKGTHEVPDILFDQLPSTAIVVEGAPELEPDMDARSPSVDVVVEDDGAEIASLMEEVSQMTPAQQRMAKAREARNAKLSKGA